MRLTALNPFGVELAEFVVRNANEEDFRAFTDAFREHSLVLVRDPGMTPEEQIEILGRLGPVAVEAEGYGKTLSVEHDPSIAKGPDFGKGEVSFHFDLCATDDWPYQILSLYGEIVTGTGGETKFANGGRAFTRLSEATKAAVRKLRAVHIFDPYAPPTSSRPTEDMMGKFVERGIHDVVRPHPYGNGEVLTVAYSTTDRIVGMPADEGNKLIEGMFDALYAPELIYKHDWRVGDLLVWDNRVVQHARNNFDSSKHRKLRRVVIGNGSSIQTRYQRWFEQIPIEVDCAEKYRPGRVLYPGDRGVWYGMPRIS